MFRAFRGAESGNVAVMFGVLAIPVLGLLGAAVDYANASRVRSAMQEAMDAAVLAGALAPADQRVAIANSVYRANLSSGLPTTTPTFQTQGDGTFKGTSSANVPTSILPLVGVSNMPVGVEAAAAVSTAGNRACFLVLDPTGSQAFLGNSNARINAPDCEMHVRSTGSPAAIFNSGNAFTLKRFCVRGSSVIQNSVTIQNLELNCAAVTDPFAGKLPTPPSTTCQFNNLNYNGGTVNLTPGVYCGWINFNGAPTVNLSPGLYVIRNGGWNVNGGVWTGNGVTFYFADTSKIQFNSGMSVSLTAPTSGTYNGILFYEAPGLSNSDFIFNNSVRNDMTGLIYLPSRNVTFNSGSQVASNSLSFVMWRLIVNASTEWRVQPNDTWPISTQGGTPSGARLVN